MADNGNPVINSGGAWINPSMQYYGDTSGGDIPKNIGDLFQETERLNRRKQRTSGYYTTAMMTFQAGGTSWTSTQNP